MEKIEKVRKKIKHIRLEKKLTQQNLADELGISQKSFMHIEKGKSKLKVEILLQLAKILDKKVTDFFE